VSHAKKVQSKHAKKVATHRAKAKKAALKKRR